MQAQAPPQVPLPSPMPCNLKTLHGRVAVQGEVDPEEEGHVTRAEISKARAEGKEDAGLLSCPRWWGSVSGPAGDGARVVAGICARKAIEAAQTGLVQPFGMVPAAAQVADGAEGASMAGLAGLAPPVFGDTGRAGLSSSQSNSEFRASVEHEGWGKAWVEGGSLADANIL